ncbi:mitochondrial fission ELM1 family protein [Hyphomonas sp.]|jgi:mitochondrial fission protein ELM1|uniref:mitochondrial fission ELM1 family protein n=1 Tax=Hyphomonas sp. TaxID=87 RepID=UPI002096D496|nr:mitochondrial fission ELM1 family protein [Hyphomonas sp.]MCO7237440.1 mitochondrial fission ELM1 family protein [Cobetia sp. Dlab-2-U]MEE2922460.1 mitochondrial fission ELM1 family protein [Pseudomonadota bacterium]
MAETGSLGPSVWAVSDGRAGNAAQVRAVLQALGDTRRWIQIAHINGAAHRSQPLELTPRLPWTLLPADKWPSPLASLPRDQRALLTEPWPTVWIAAGRRSAPLTRAIRDLSGGKTLTVQILDPKIAPENFDLLVTPEHDEVSGPNVIRTVGSPSYFAPDLIEQAGQSFADLADERSKSAIIILGGTSKAHTFTEAAADRLIAQLRILAGQGWRLRITTSRRTPVPVVAKFRAMADEIGARFWAGPEDGENPYLAWLVFSDCAIVTEDSANMLSDAAWHNLPIHIARLEGRSDKFDKLHQSLIDHGAARWFGGVLETWSYPALREADRVADAIVARLLERHPQPDMGGDETRVAPPDWME